METRNCPKCGSKLYNNKGISPKNNRPWENWKCGKCPYIEWVDLKQVPLPAQPNGNGDIILLEEMQTFKETMKNLGEYLTKHFGKDE
jgi:ribosomal protein S27AE